MAELNFKGKLKVKLGGIKERFYKHTDDEKAFIKEHGQKAAEVLNIKRKISKKMPPKKTWGNITDKEREYLMDAGVRPPHIPHE